MEEESGGGRASIPTEPDPVDLRRQTRARLGRRVFVVTLGLFLLLGAFNVYGVRSQVRSASAGGYELSVTYAGVTRPGLATPWSIEISHPGGFPDGVVVAVTSSYFDAFDENGFGPTPVEETIDGEWIVFQFAPTVGDTFDASLDARIEPGVQLARVKGRVELRSAPGGPVLVGVNFTTLVMP